MQDLDARLETKKIQGAGRWLGHEGSNSSFVWGGWTTRAPLVDVVQCAVRSNRRAMLEATPMRGERRHALARPGRKGVSFLAAFKGLAASIRLPKQKFVSLRMIALEEANRSGTRRRVRSNEQPSSRSTTRFGL
jgi:hypothetical protein